MATTVATANPRLSCRSHTEHPDYTGANRVAPRSRQCDWSQATDGQRSWAGEPKTTDRKRLENSLAVLPEARANVFTQRNLPVVSAQINPLGNTPFRGHHAEIAPCWSGPVRATGSERRSRRKI